MKQKNGGGGERKQFKKRKQKGQAQQIVGRERRERVS